MASATLQKALFAAYNDHLNSGRFQLYCISSRFEDESTSVRHSILFRHFVINYPIRPKLKSIQAAQQSFRRSPLKIIKN